MDDIENKCLSESGKTERTDMKERAELSYMPVRDEGREDKENESPRNENEEEEEMEDSLQMQLWTNNYIIVREIMSHLDWRDLLRCELVCRLWRDAVKSLQRVNLRSYDFAMGVYRIPIKSQDPDYKIEMEISDLPVQTRPMFVICFYRHRERLRCQNFIPAPCDPACADTHDIIEAAHGIVLSKLSCLLLVNYLYGQIYKPLPTSRTRHYTTSDSLLVGLYLPKMPNVNHRMVQYRTRRTVQEDVYSIFDDICTTDIVKGVVVFVSGHDEATQQAALGLLNYIKNKQRSIPYAQGGVIMRKVVCKGSVYEKDSRVNVGVFSVPKEPEEPVTCCQFNMYSLIIDSTVQEEAAIQKVIQTFAENIPKLPFSAALQLSCMDRVQANIEQNLFRCSFPHTRLVGCYSRTSSIIGSSHPEPDICPLPAKRTNNLSDGEPELRHHESTVFIYFSWGQ